MSREMTSVTEIGNDLSIVSDCIDSLTRPVQDFLAEQDLYALKTALTEMLVNAIEHGNLGITFEEKKDALEASTFDELLKERTELAEKSGKKVNVYFRLDCNCATYRIQDSGAGFDQADLPDPEDPESIWLENGRGIQMSKALVDKVAYNDRGNEVTVVKYFAKTEVESQAG